MLEAVSKPNGLTTTQFSAAIKERRRVVFNNTARSLDAECGRKVRRPADGPEKARLLRCRTSTYHLDTDFGSRPRYCGLFRPIVRSLGFVRGS